MRDDDVVALDTSDRLFFVFFNWPHVEHIAFLFDTMGKAKVISQDVKKRIMELGNNLQILECATFICLKNYRTFQTISIYFFYAL